MKAFRFSLIQAGPRPGQHCQAISVSHPRSLKAAGRLTTLWRSGRWRRGRFTTSSWRTGELSVSLSPGNMTSTSVNNSQYSRSWLVSSLKIGVKHDTSYQEMVSVSGSESENDGAKQFLVSKSTTKDGESADNIKPQERLDILSSSYSRSVPAQLDVD